jgi:hypothetical protein
MGRKIVAELVQPLYDEHGRVVHEPGDRFDEDDKALKGLPPGHVRYLVVDGDPEPAPKPAKDEAKAKASETKAKSSGG